MEHKHVIYHLKHLIWKLRIYKLFREIFKFRDFKKAFLNFAKSVIAHILAILKHFTKQTIYSDSPDHVKWFCQIFQMTLLVGILIKLLKLVNRVQSSFLIYERL